MSKIEATLRLVEPLIPGEEVNASLTLLAKKPVTIDWLSWTLHGYERWGNGTQHHAWASQRLLEGTRLHGTIACPIRFVLPRDLPPTFSYGGAEISYVLRVDVSIPWARDPHWSWRLRLEAPRLLGPIPHEPVVVRSEGGVELSLDRQCFVPGDVVTGRIAWPGKDAPLEVHLGVRERLSGEAPDRRFGVILPLDRHAAAGTSFSFQLPPNLTPSFTTKWVTLRWDVYVAQRAPTAFRDFTQLTAPITIVSGAQEGQATAASTAPVVGRARLRDAAARVGYPMGWRTDEDSIDRTFEVGFLSLEASVHWDQRDRPYLVAELTMPSVMLGLTTRVRAFLDRLDTSSVLSHDLAFVGHEPAQVQAFLTPILARAERNGLMLAKASDTCLVFECIDARGDDSTLRAFLRSIEDLLALLPEAMQAIPPMREVSVDVEAMRRFADALKGTFTPGDCSVRGTHALGHALHAHVLVPLAGELPSHLEVRLEGLVGELSIARGGQLLRGPASLRGFAEALDPHIALEVGGGVGSAMLSVPERRVVVSPQVVLALAESLLRASQLASGNSIFR